MHKNFNIGIIDFEKKGNVVRFYMGNRKADYHGDDWNDRPYEHNAGKVYDEYISHYIDVAFPMESTVLEPADDWRNNGNSDWSKNDMKARRVPCIIVVPDGYDSDSFSQWCGAEGIGKFYFGDTLDKAECGNLHISRYFNVVDMYYGYNGDEEEQENDN